MSDKSDHHKTWGVEGRVIQRNCMNSTIVYLARFEMISLTSFRNRNTHGAKD